MKMLSVEQRLRIFLLGLVAFMCLGTVVELLLANHTKEPMQFIPFVLCGIGFLAAVAALIRPQRRILIALRMVMGLLIAGSLLGMYEHLAGNLAFEFDIRPSAGTTTAWLLALKGAAPLLAPGILALAGILAIAATYEHPALTRA